MAALIPNQMIAQYVDGVTQKTVLFSLLNADAADTADLAPWFKIVKRAGIISATGTHVLAAAVSANTVVTVPAGPVDDGLWLLVVGVST